MPPALGLALGLIGAAALVRWCVRQVQHVNTELEEVRQRARTEPVDRGALPTLKRDPNSGEYRPG